MPWRGEGGASLHRHTCTVALSENEIKWISISVCVRVCSVRAVWVQCACVRMCACGYQNRDDVKVLKNKSAKEVSRAINTSPPAGAVSNSDLVCYNPAYMHMKLPEHNLITRALT